MAPYAHASACDGLYDRLRSLLWVERDSSGAPSIRSSRGTRLAHRFIADFARDFRFDVQCGAMQRLCEDTILEWMSAWIRHLGLERDGVAIGLGGGVFMNVKANMRVAQQPWARTVTPIPAAATSRAPLVQHSSGTWTPARPPGGSPQYGRPTDIYLGPGWDDADVKPDGRSGSQPARAAAWSAPRISPTEPPRLLADGHVVARFHGRMEWGARALGNRSILADPSRHEQRARDQQTHQEPRFLDAICRDCSCRFSGRVSACSSRSGFATHDVCV